MKIKLSCFVLMLLTVKTFAQKPELILPLGHTMFVNSVQFSPDDKYIVTGSADKTARLWEANTGRLINTFAGHTNALAKATFSPRGRYIVTTSSYDKTLNVWETGTGKLINSFTGEVSCPTMAFSPDESFLVVGREDGSAQILEVPTMKLIRDLRGHTARVLVVEVTNDGKRILTGSSDGTVKIWDANTGQRIQDLGGHPDGVADAHFSVSGKFIVTVAVTGKTARVWATEAGQMLKELRGHSYFVNSAKFTTNEKFVLTMASDGTAKLWDIAAGRAVLDLKDDVDLFQVSADGRYLLYSEVSGMRLKIYETTTGKTPVLTYPMNKGVQSAAFSSDGKRVVIGLWDNTTEVRESATGKLMRRLEGHANPVTYAEFSPDGRHMVTASGDVFNMDSIARIWDVATGKLMMKLKGSERFFEATHFSPDGKYLLTAGDSKIRIWDPLVGNTTAEFSHAAVRQAEFSPDGKAVITASGEFVKVWETLTRKEVRSLKLFTMTGDESKDMFPKTFYPVFAKFSPDGKYLFGAVSDSAKIWDAATGRLVKKLRVTGKVYAAGFSPDAKYLITSHGSSATIWETSTGKLVNELVGHEAAIGSSAFSADGKYIVTGADDNKAKLWDARTGKWLRDFAGHTARLTSAQFSPDGKYVITASRDKTIKIWDAASGRLLKDLSGHRNDINSLKFSKDGKYIVTTSDDLSTRLWDVTSGRELLTLYSVDHSDWVVTEPSGLFDASPGAMDKLYYRQGIDLINLAQMKERYYEPGLWKRIIPGEKLRRVETLNTIEMPPLVQVSPVDEKGYLLIELTNRGGGIGEVAIYIQGKEVVKDARDKNANPDAQTLKVSYYVAGHKNLINGDNLIGVKAWNKNHWVESRGEIITYTKGKEQAYRPSVHILTAGVSDYAGGSEIDLTYAAKDADDMSKALALGASRLFGTQKSYVYRLSTSQPENLWPTKTNIINTFGKIAAAAHPMDVVIVYLSGHGTTVGGSEGDWVYLTQEASTVTRSGYDDPSARKKATLSSNELVELFKTIPASKQVLIIDACASGRVVDNLIASRDVPSSTLRALDRMSGRTGMHIITGCTADAVSYEASQYGQGVLTYSLLEGIRGAALRDDTFVDVNKLFQYAQDRVPSLAEGIGGIQTPMVFSPQGSQSFDIGQLTESDKKSIPISKVRPVYILSNFQDEEELSDVLGLGKKVDQLMGESAARGSEAPVIFVPVREYPEGCQLVGRYTQTTGKIALKLKRKCEGKDQTFEISGTDVDEVASQILLVATK